MVELKRKVTLKVKSPQESVAENVKAPVKEKSERTLPDKTVNESRSSKKIWILLAGVAAAIVLGYFLLTPGNEKTDVDVNSNLDEQVDSSTETTTDTNAEVNPKSAEQTESPAENNTDTDVKVTPKSAEQVDSPTEAKSNTNAEVMPNSIEKDESPVEIIADESLKQLALDVIRGNYGNGLERKVKLGDRYAAVQALVNRMYREGSVR